MKKRKKRKTRKTGIRTWVTIYAQPIKMLNIKDTWALKSSSFFTIFENRYWYLTSSLSLMFSYFRNWIFFFIIIIYFLWGGVVWVWKYLMSFKSCNSFLPMCINVHLCKPSCKVNLQNSNNSTVSNRDRNHFFYLWLWWEY